MSNYKLTFKLKQHTPYIHFQHNHLGATLRASDLKPRIDKYLYDDFKLEKQKYQLTISSKLKEDYPKNSSPGKEPYFGKHKLCRYDFIELKFNTYFNTKLDEKIKEILPKVFTCENFGSFGSKGYGCFTVDDGQTQSGFQDLLKEKYKTVYYWETKNTSDGDIFFQIKYFYALLKAGINVPGRDAKSSTYYKSLLMQYFLPDIRWEKRGIKKEFGLTKDYRATYLDDGQSSINDDETYKAVKPLLGYSESQEWQSYGLKNDKKYPANSNPILIEFPDKDNIKRIPSPLFFKVFKAQEKATIYFMLKNEDKFKNKIYGPNKTYIYTIKDKPPAEFKAPETFDYTAFFKDSITKINSINPGNATFGTAKDVDDFFKKLKGNMKSL